MLLFPGLEAVKELDRRAAETTGIAFKFAISTASAPPLQFAALNSSVCFLKLYVGTETAVLITHGADGPSPVEPILQLNRLALC